MRLRVLSAGAAQGFATRLAAERGVELEGAFGAVGGILDRFLAGELCDLLVLTHAQAARVMAQARVDPGFCSDLGTVRTCVAVRAGDRAPAVSSAPALSAALLEADEIHVPDPALATAGIHFLKVLDALGIAATVAPRLRRHANGMTAMRALGGSSARALGCTQATEILATPTVSLVAPLPEPLGLATVYTALLPAAGAAGAAAGFAAELAGPARGHERAAAGFEGPAISRATRAHSAAARELVFAILAEYGFTPDPAGIDADLADLEAGFLAEGGMFDVALEADGSLAACCGLKVLAGGRLELRKMYVRRDRRGQGLGQRLLDRALAWARGRGFARVELETASVLTEAIALYRKAGFTPRSGKPGTCRCDQAFELSLG